MVSWVPHLLFPLLAALALFPQLPRRAVWAWSPIVWLLDLDYLIPGEHRASSHNLLVALAPLLPLWLLWRRSVERGAGERLWRFALRPGWPVGLLLSSYYLASHLFLDLFAGGVVLFWPLWDRNLYLDFEIILDTRTNTFTPVASAGSHEGAPALSPEYPWLTYEHTALVAFLAVVGAVALPLALARRRGRGRRGRRS